MSIMGKNKHAWTVKIGEKGQIVIPKEARELFGYQPGDTLLILGDDKRGMGIPPRADVEKIISKLIGITEGEE